MKTIGKVLAVLFVAMVLFSCQDKIEETYLVNEPVYMTYNELRNSFKSTEGEIIKKPGKIYFKDNFIFVNEYQEGIHIINNTDPSNPQIIKFLEIPGNVDIAIKGAILYADSYVDLLSIDISDMENIQEVDRDTSVFPYIIPEYEDGILESVNESRGVIVGYKVTEKTEKVEENYIDYPMFGGWAEDAMYTTNVVRTASVETGSGTGTGGSMARFTLVGSYLYVINNYELMLFNISNGSNPVFAKDKYIGWNIETLFPYNDKLFIGSQTGMYVFNIMDPANPEYISQFRHASACDPVVVEGDYAYVTLRAGNLCGAIESQLDVIDISTIIEPKLVKTYAMEEPYGLGIDNDVLFICDGDAGLKIYDATDKLNIDSNMVASYPNMDAFDVIPLGDVLLLISIDGLFQYDYSSLDNITELSHIPIYGDD